MRFTLVILLFLWFCRPIQAQDVELSMPQKIPSKISEYEILGKSNEGLLIWKSGGNYNLIEAFDPNTLDLRWSRELAIGSKRAEIVTILEIRNELFVFYTDRAKTDYTLYAAKYDTKLRNIGEPIVMDEYKRPFGSYGYEYEVEFDIGRNWFAIVRKEAKMAPFMATTVQVIWSDRDLNKLQTNSVAVEKDWNFSGVIVKEDGKAFFIQSGVEHTFLSQSALVDKILITAYDFVTQEFDYILLDDDKKLFNDYSVEWDPINKQLLVSGFYSDEKDNNILGYFYAPIDPNGEEAIPISFASFTDEFIKKVGRKSVFGQVNNLQYIEIRKLIVRSDGGALLIGESHSTNSGAGNMSPLMYDNRYSSRRQVLREHYFDDVLVFSINPDGTTHWQEILKKKQYSENDEGYFSSIGFMNTNRSVHLLFNESVSKNVNMNDFSVESSGKYRIKTLFNPADLKISPAPRFAMQISSSEIIIPAINQRNEFLLVKLTY